MIIHLHIQSKTEYSGLVKEACLLPPEYLRREEATIVQMGKPGSIAVDIVETWDYELDTRAFTSGPS
jgi:hypothetical protein